MMLTFQDLYIKLKNYDIEKFVELLAQQCNEKWQRDLDQEKNMRLLGEMAICFKRLADDPIKSAGLTLFKKENNILYVPNIVPLETSQFSTTEYNLVLKEFVEEILRPTLKDNSITQDQIDYELTPEQVFIEDIAGEDVAKELNNFSALANKSTGSYHPCDKERWFNFLVTANKAGKSLYTDLLENTLIEQGWSADMANKLATEYEFAQSLLNYTKEH